MGSKEKLATISEGKPLKNCLVTPRDTRFSIKESDQRQINFQNNSHRFSYSQVDSVITSPNTKAQQILVPNSASRNSLLAGRRGTSSSYSQLDKLETDRNFPSGSQQIQRFHASSSHQTQNIRNSTPQLFKKAQLDEVIQRKQMQMFLDAQKKSKIDSGLHKRSSSTNLVHRKVSISQQQQQLQESQSTLTQQVQQQTKSNNNQNLILQQPQQQQPSQPSQRKSIINQLLQQHPQQQQQPSSHQNENDKPIVTKRASLSVHEIHKKPSSIVLIQDNLYQKSMNNLHEGTSNIVDETLAHLESQKFKKRDENFNDIIKSSVDAELQSKKHYQFS